MTQHAFHRNISGKRSIDRKKLLGILCAVFILIAGMTIFQDFLESLRSDRPFYFSESLLFKTIWFLFIPILIVLYKKLKNQNFTGPYSAFLLIIVPVCVHYVILPFVVLFFSVLFYDGRYDLYKIFSYTLANDLYKLVLVYSTFVLGYNYFSSPIWAKTATEEKKYPENIVISNGKDNSIVKISEIVQIVAATPYVTIQLDNKKYLYTTTLRSLSELLDQNDFIRVHKSTIVNKNEVASYKSRLNGDYDLLLKNGEKTRLSRTYAASFKKRFQPDNRVSQ